MNSQDVYSLLASVGIPAKVHGHRYIIRAVGIIMNDEEASFAMTKRVYMQVADDYSISLKQVENAMRTAIEHAWRSGRCDRQEVIFGYSRLAGKRPTNSEFLIRLTEYLSANDN